MNHKYSHILSPLRINDVVLKNRLCASKCFSQEIQGPETFPAEVTARFLEDMAKNGAAVITCPIGSYPDANGSYGRNAMHMDSRLVKNYFNRLIDRIHAHGSVASAGLQTSFPGDVQISVIRDPNIITSYGNYDHMAFNGTKPEISHDQIKKVIDDVVWQCKDLKTLGFDMVNIHMSYRRSILAQSLSPALNQREDEYGGSPENRIRLCKEMFAAIKDTCGKNFLIECQISGEEEQPYGYTVEDFLNYCQMLEGLVDIFQVRAFDMGYSHPNSSAYERGQQVTLKYAEAFKKRGIKAVVSPSGGFQDPDEIEKDLAEGKCDMVTMARAFIADPEYGKKLYAGRNDYVPCIRCDKCHGAICSVNPRHGLNHVAETMFSKTAEPKKVAVIGGGPAGMKAAITAAQRGHRVTLFEKSDKLGGQLIHADYMSFKWHLKDYKDYLIRQVMECGAEVRLNTAATRETIASGNYDAVIAACGSVGKRIDCIPGSYGKNTLLPMEVYANTPGKRVVVVGGGQVGAETAVGLAFMGHEVTLITRRPYLSGTGGHGGSAFKDKIDACSNFKYALGSQTTVITENSVTYVDAEGIEHTVECDSVVISGGRRACVDECMEFAGLAPKFFVVGDSSVNRNNHWCAFRAPAGKAPDIGGSVRHSTYTGYNAAMDI